uniref:Uncharacterized protein n=1 Tax=Rhizophora mucronata TaxID=61149 RepID=A0A2P2Q1S5_RHIMU
MQYKQINFFFLLLTLLSTSLQ